MTLTLPPYLLPDEQMLALADLAVAAQVDTEILADTLGCEARYVRAWGYALGELYYGEACSSVASLALARRVADLTGPESYRLAIVPTIHVSPALLREACCALLVALEVA